MLQTPSFLSARTAATSLLLCALAGTATMASAATVIDVTEDVMTSSFFTGTNLVRGYAGDNRPVFRVSTNNPFGTSGAETIYLDFGYDFTAFSGPVTATLTMQSVDGGFGANASAGFPFDVSAHGVSAAPLSTITDNTNPGGTVGWLDFYNNYILPADAAASTTVNGFGSVTFDVSALVNSWIAGTNGVHAIALTGKNDVSGVEFLHGFLNNTEAPGSTFLTVTAVPEPQTYALLLAGLALVGGLARHRRAN